MESEFRQSQGLEHATALLKNLRLHWLTRHLPARGVQALYVAVNSFLTVGLLSTLAWVTRNPFVFPSLGPTAYMYFFHPMDRASCPRHSILGHGIGLLCGYAALLLTGTAFLHGPATGVSRFWPTILSAALSLAATGAFMILLRVSHPPAGATTLIVSLGLISQPRDLLIIELAVVLLTVQAFVINRLAGLPYPLWEARPDTPEHS